MSGVGPLLPVAGAVAGGLAALAAREAVLASPAVARLAIGENTVVGAGSVVVKDLPAGVLAVGNPARVVRDL